MQCCGFAGESCGKSCAACRGAEKHQGGRVQECEKDWDELLAEANKLYAEGKEKERRGKGCRVAFTDQAMFKEVGDYMQAAAVTTAMRLTREVARDAESEGALWNVEGSGTSISPELKEKVRAAAAAWEQGQWPPARNRARHSTTPRICSTSSSNILRRRRRASPSDQKAC